MQMAKRGENNNRRSSLLTRRELTPIMILLAT
jgi:hypothetical protein